MFIEPRNDLDRPTGCRAMLAVVALCVGIAPAFGDSRSWELVEDEDGIKVWSREVPDSDIREVRALTIMDVPASRIRQVLANTGDFPEFMPYVEEARVIESNRSGRVVYQRVDPPMVSPRDYVLRVTTEADRETGRYVRRWSIANRKDPPPREDVVRVRTNRGRWTLQRLSEERTRVEYYLFTEPGGSIPSWIVNYANSNSVPKLLKAVSKRARNPDWTQ